MSQLEQLYAILAKKKYQHITLKEVRVVIKELEVLDSFKCALGIRRML